MLGTGFIILGAAVIGVIVVVKVIEIGMHYENRPDDPDDVITCPHCKSKIPRLSVECMECKEPLT